MDDFVITQPVAVVPLVIEAPVGTQPDLEQAPALQEQQADELYRNHIQECVSDVLQGRNSAVIAYGDAGPRGRSMLCMPGTTGLNYYCVWLIFSFLGLNACMITYVCGSPAVLQLLAHLRARCPAGRSSCPLLTRLPRSPPLLPVLCIHAL